MTCRTSVGKVVGSPRPAFAPRSLTMPRSFAVNAPTIFEAEETANVSDLPFREAPWRLAPDTLIVTKPFVVPLAGV